METDIKNAAELLVYLESLRDRNVPLHKLEIQAVCSDCDRLSVMRTVVQAVDSIRLDWS